MFICQILIHSFHVIIFVHFSYSQRLTFKNIDFKVEQFERHRTMQFYDSNITVSNVIIRRGDIFEFSVELNNEFSGEQIQTILTFETRFDQMIVDLPSTIDLNGWEMQQSGSDNAIHVKIKIPSHAPVGIWAMKLLIKDKTGDVIEQLESPHKVIVLFNPWSTEDAAYFDDQNNLEEYVMNERGITYSFNYEDWRSTPWIYGQFQNGVLESILFAMSRASLSANQRGDIVLVTREITNLLNDDGRYYRGVLQGKWKEPYGPLDGRPTTKPTDWTGSPPIFKQYLESGGLPVGYGQCWVFAGILTTAYRALGIAARPVSNFVSAHSKQRDLTIDIFLNEKGEIRNQELVWNFHVWVQAWFKRNDIGSSYSGWQELDATPQEFDNWRYQVGPTSTAAIRSSQLRVPYQTAFLYEEINSDEVVYSSENKIVDIIRNSIGLAVLTKQPGSDEFEDITRLYKPQENTFDERESYRLAAESLDITPPSPSSVIPRAASHEVNIEILTPKDLLIGSMVQTKIFVQNPSSIAKTIELGIKATSLYYYGEVAAVLKAETYSIKIPPLRTSTVYFNITPNEYIGRLRDMYTIRIECVARRGQSVAFTKKLFSLSSPTLYIYAPKSVNVNQPFLMDVQIQNPYNQRLSDCHIAVEGTRIGREVLRIPDLAPLSVGHTQLRLWSSYAAKEKIVVHFFCGELLRAMASTEISVNGRRIYQFAKYVMKPTTPEMGNYEYETKNNYYGITPRSFARPKVTTITPDFFECCNLIPIYSEFITSNVY